jgi:hypothetical protein
MKDENQLRYWQNSLPLHAAKICRILHIHSIMRQLFILLLILSAALVSAQSTLSNGGFNHWQGGVFSPGNQNSHGVTCCGVALAVPIGWGIPEILMAMPTNQFTYKETDTAYIHSGSFSARLATNITDMDSAGDVAGDLAVLVPGRVTCAGIVGLGSLGIMGDLYQTIAYSTGDAFTDTPSGMSFYMMMAHDNADTVHYAYVFTRWDSAAHIEDTLAYKEADIADSGLPYKKWMQFNEPITYLHAGLPDTLHLIFYGGRNGDSTKYGNTTWLDDISFYHGDPSTGLVHLSLDDAIAIYPNPAATTINIRADQYMTGYTMALYDLTGRAVINETLTGQLSSYSIASLTNGVYLYRLLDKNSAQVTSGKITIEK